MTQIFSDKDIKKIQKVLKVVPQSSGSAVRFEIKSPQLGRSLALEIYREIDIGSRQGPLISVYTSNAHLQLHFCTGFVTSELLGEVTFVGESDGTLSGLTIESEGGCSLYANVDRSVLSGDFTKLGPEVMLSGVALSVTESILPELPLEGETVHRAAKRKVRRRV